MPEETLYSPLDDPLFLSQTDQPSLTLSSFLFDGSNFVQWQREIIWALLSKNKVGFITGECPCPPATDKKHNSWVRCDILVSRWIKNSIAKPIVNNLQYAASAKSLWSDILERYGQLNVLDLYALKKDLSNVSQDTSSILDYYGKIKNLWENIDTMDPIPQCTCGAMNNCTCQLLKRLLDRHYYINRLRELLELTLENALEAFSNSVFSKA
ncbi:uncharacterized protein LOC141600536 [Silene latifolia]|uniref:uncharacterized protein LOC141600536 n=1 Tax=Silene latifolia TaxID=37657 RepID=UPI003D775918